MGKNRKPLAGAQVDVSRIEHENLAAHLQRLEREMAELRKQVDELLKKKEKTTAA